MKTQPDVIVIGAGAAGIIAAWRAASLGAKVVLLEKTNRIGTKILVSGGGKCNITHDGALEDVLRSFRPNEGRFIRPACYRFTNRDVVEMFTSKGLRVYTRDDGRIFPVDQTAKDVVGILRAYLEESKVDLRFDCPVSGILVEDGRVVGVRYRHSPSKRTASSDREEASAGYRPATAKNLLKELGSANQVLVGDEHELRAKQVIVCPGGSSYPNSGTTGDGWNWLRELGHSIVKVRAALAPVYLHLEEDSAAKAGIALREVVLKAKAPKEVARWHGDLLFTHQGISGPTVLGISRIVAEKMVDETVTVEVDLAPLQSQEDLQAELLKFAADHPKRKLIGYIEERVPERLAPEILEQAGIDLECIAARLDKKSRNRLVGILKAWPLGTVRHVPLEKGEVVAGGVALDEVDPKTMESKRVHGLYLCGEVLDIAGPVGGYNLQAAFATGFVAGESAAQASS